MARWAFSLAVLSGVCLAANAYHQKYVEKVEDSVQEESSQSGVRMFKQKPKQANYQEEGRGDSTWHGEDELNIRQSQRSQDQNNQNYGQMYHDQQPRQEYSRPEHQNVQQSDQKHPITDQYDTQYHQQHYHEEPKIFKQEHVEHVKVYSKKPYLLYSEKKATHEVKVPYPVYIPQPYPVYVEKKMPFEVEVPVPRPFTIERKVPYDVQVIGKPYPVPVEKPFPVFVDKKIPFIHKPVYHVPHGKPYPVPVVEEKEVPYQQEPIFQYPVNVDGTPLILPPIDPMNFDGEKKLEYPYVKTVPVSKSPLPTTPMEEGRPQTTFEFPQSEEQSGGSGEQNKKQEQEETASISEMGETPRDQSSGTGAQESYGAVELNKSSEKQVQEKRPKQQLDVKRSVGKSFMHSSMQTNGKHTSFSSAVDHY